MSWSWPTAGEWLCRSAVGGGLLLLIVWGLLRRTRQPARRQRLGECGVVAALVLALLNLGPSWLVFSISVPERRTTTETSTAAGNEPVQASRAQAPGAVETPRAKPAKVPGPPAPPAAVPPGPVLAPGPARAEPGSPSSSVALEPPPVPEHPAAAGRSERAAFHIGAGTLPFSKGSVLAWLGVAYALGAGFMAVRWLLGHLALWRLLQQARPAGAALQSLLAELRPGPRRPRLLVSRRLRMPVSCGLWRPTIVLPDSLCAARSAALRWVLIHEATHLERRDPWTCLLLGLGQLVYYYLPWFWWLRREVGVCQEFIADAAVACREERPEDYAEFLLLLTRAPRAPVGATGVTGTPSDLFQRVTMLLRAPMPVETACPALWSCTAVGSLATLALLGSAVRLETITAPVATPPAMVSSFANQPENKAEKQEVQATTSGSGKAMVQDRGPPESAQALPAVARPMAWGRLGLRIASPNATVAEQLDLPTGTGLVVEEVLPGTPAAGAGIKVHDILLSIDSRAVPSSAAVLSEPPANLPIGVPVDVVVLRKRRRELVHGLVVPQAEPDRRLTGPPAGPALVPGLVPPAPPSQPHAGESVTTLLRAGDGFFAWHQENGVFITLAGTTSGGRCCINEIVVQAGGISQKYQTVEQVPAEFRAEVKTLVGLSEQGSVRIEVRPS